MKKVYYDNQYSFYCGCKNDTPIPKLEEVKTILIREDTALCNSKITDVKIIIGFKEKEVKHILCLLDEDNIKVCSECVSMLYK